MSFHVLEVWIYVTWMQSKKNYPCGLWNMEYGLVVRGKGRKSSHRRGFVIFHQTRIPTFCQWWISTNILKFQGPCLFYYMLLINNSMSSCEYLLHITVISVHELINIHTLHVRNQITVSKTLFLFVRYQYFLCSFLVLYVLMHWNGYKLVVWFKVLTPNNKFHSLSHAI